MLRDIFTGGQMKSFAECRQEFNLNEAEHFHYIQIWHWALTEANRQAASLDLILRNGC